MQIKQLVDVHLVMNHKYLSPVSLEQEYNMAGTNMIMLQRVLFTIIKLFLRVVFGIEVQRLNDRNRCSTLQL
jgi:hypothetical protein